MADVTPYRDQITPELGPNIGTDAMISAARRVGPLEREAGLMEQQGAAAIGQAAKGVFDQREKVAALKEIAQGHESFATLHGQHTQDFQQMLGQTDPAHFNQAVQNFKEQTLDPETAKWVQSFQTEAGQEWAANHAGEINGQLLEHAHETMDAITANNSIAAMHNAAQQYAANAIADPTSTERQIAAAQSGIKAMAAQITDPVIRSKFEEQARNTISEIATAGIHAATDVGTGIGRALAQKLASYISPEHQSALSAYAKATDRNNAFQARLDEAEQRRRETDQVGKAYNEFVTTKLMGPDGKPQIASDAMANILAISRLPGAAHDPGLIRSMVNELKQTQNEILSGKATQDDPATLTDLQNRMLLAPDDPRFPTELEISRDRNAGLLSANSAQEYRTLSKSAEENPGLKSALTDFKTFTDSQKPPSTSGYEGSSSIEQSNNSYFTFTQDRREKFLNGLRLGVPSHDLLDPKSPKFIGFMSDQEKSSTAINPAQNAAPASIQQQRASTAADLAVAVTNLVKNNSVDAARNILQQSGLEVPANMGDGAWCAPLVNTVLKAVGLPPAGDNFASSFKNWGAPIDAGQVQKGDVFYVPAAGYTGHVGIVLDSHLRAGPHGEPQVEVVSTHLQGDPSNPGGVEWRDVGPLIFRRAKPPQADIKANQASNPAWWQRFIPSGPSMTGQP